MIRIQNIYHMLAYAFQVLCEQGYREMATEEFDNAAELCAAILIRGTNSQVKRGLGREYIDLPMHSRLYEENSRLPIR